MKLLIFEYANEFFVDKNNNILRDEMEAVQPYQNIQNTDYLKTKLIRISISFYEILVKYVYEFRQNGGSTTTSNSTKYGSQKCIKHSNCL